MDKWDQRFLQLAKLVSEWSKDPSTRVGSVAVSQDRRIISTGYNGFPSQLTDDGRRFDRQTKYKLTVHAEANLIINSVLPIKNSVVYTYPMAPCSKCALLLVQAGVRRVVSQQLSEELARRWLDDVCLAEELYKEAGVKVEYYDIDDMDHAELDQSPGLPEIKDYWCGHRDEGLELDNDGPWVHPWRRFSLRRLFGQ